MSTSTTVMPPSDDKGPRLDRGRASKDASMPVLRLHFCGTVAGYVLRKAFKSKFPSAPSISFARQWGSGVEGTKVPNTQFDLIVKDVCRECNQGWLNDLTAGEGALWPRRRFSR